MDDELLKLYEGVSSNLDVGTYEEFSAKMGTPEERKNFYDAVGKAGFDLGDYNSYEERLKKKVSSEPTSTGQESVSTSTTEEEPTDSGIGEVNLSNKDLGIKDEPVTADDWDVGEAYLDIERKKLYNQVKNASPEDRAKMGFDSVPETYEEFSSQNPTLKEKLAAVPAMADPAEREAIIQADKDNKVRVKQGIFDKVATYSKQKWGEFVAETMSSETKLTEEEKAFAKSESARLKRGDLTFSETVESIALGYAEKLFSGNAMSIIPAQRVLPESDQKEIKAEMLDRKKVDFFKGLDDEDRNVMNDYINYSPEGGKAKLENLTDTTNELLKESAYFEDRMLRYSDNPTYKEFQKLKTSEEAETFLKGLEPEAKQEFLDEYSKMMELYELHQANLTEFNSNEDDLQNYEIEADLANRYFGLGNNMAMSFVEGVDRMYAGTLGAIADPLVELNKPDDMSYQEYRELAIKGSYLEYLEGNLEMIESKKVGRRLNDNPFSLERIALLASEQLPVLAVIGTGGNMGLGVMGASTYGNKVNEYSQDGEVTATERFAATIAAGGEVLSERITQGILSKGGRAFKAAKGQNVASREFSKNFAKGVVNTAGATLEEGSSEVLAALAENYADIHIVGKDNKNMLTGVKDAFIDGAIMGGIMRAAPEIAGATIGKYYGNTDELSKIKDSYTEMKGILGAAMNPDVSDATFKVLDKRLTELKKANDKRVERYISKVEKLSDKDITDLTSVGEAITKETKNLTDIRKDENLSPAIKQKLENVYESKLEKLEGKKVEILENPTKAGASKAKDTQDFFSNVVEGNNDKYKPSKEYTYEQEFNEVQKTFKEDYDSMKGNFDEHIATSIPTFRDNQVKKGSAVVDLIKDIKDALVYDIGGSEGSWLKAIINVSPDAKGINLDPNAEMEAAFNKKPVEGTSYVKEAFHEGFDNIKAHKPKKKADVVHESMVFQFIQEGRKEYVDEVADKYLKDDGVFITEEKFKVGNEGVYAANEALKDKEHKSKYYTEEQRKSKGEEVLVGMSENQHNYDDYINLLKDKFKYVETYWTAGNFRGIIATNSKSKMDTFMDKLGDNSNQYTINESEQTVQAHNRDGGSSVTQSGRPITTGYSVSPHTTRSLKIKGRNVTEEQIANFKKKNKDLLDADPNSFVGTWYDSKSDTTYVDISVHETSKSKAIELGKKHNQKAIWDFKNFTEIDTGGTGEVTNNVINDGRVDASNKEAVTALVDSLEDVKLRDIARRSFNAAKALHSILPNFNISLHPKQDSFNKARIKAGDKSKDTSRGFIEYTEMHDGSFRGSIHINLEIASPRTVAHEVSHAVMLRAFNGNKKLYDDFKNSISGLVDKDLNSDLQAFSEMYDSEEASEEYLVELIATLSNKKENLSLNTIQKIGSLINKLVSRLTNGAIVPFKNVKDTKEIMDFINKVANDISKGNDISIASTPDGSIITSKVSSNLNNSKVKKSKFIDNLKLKRFDTHSNIKVYKDFDLKDIEGQLASSTLSDKLVAGRIGKFKLYGGVGYPEATGLLWAASTESAASKILNKLKRAEDGNFYLLPAIMSNVSHMSNKDMSVIAIEVLKEAANNNELDLPSFKDYTEKLFSKKGLIKFKAGFLGNMNGIKSIDTALDTLLDYMFSNNMTFEQRRSVLESLIGESAVNNPRFKTVGTFTQLAESLSEPLVKDSSMFEVNVAYRTVGDISVVKIPETDSRYHKSYPYAIESTSKIEVLHLKDAYNLVDIFPEFTKSDGAKKSLAQEMIDKRAKYSEKYIRANLGRTHGLSSYSEPINASTPVVKNSLAPDTRTESQKEHGDAMHRKYRGEMEDRFVDDGKGNYVFRHHSNTQRDELSPRQTHGNLIIGKEEQRAINAVGGLTMFYTEKGQAEQGVGDKIHNVSIPKDKVYVFNSDVKSFYDEAKKRFSKKFPNQAFTPNFQLAYITQVASEQGYPITVAKWREGEFRGQTTSTLIPDGVKIKHNKASSNNKNKDESRFNVKKLLGGAPVLSYLDDLFHKNLTSKLDTATAAFVKKGLEHKNRLVRSVAQTATNWFNGLPRTVDELARRRKLVGEQELAYLVGEKLTKELQNIINNNPDAARNVHKVLDPDLYPDEVALTYESLDDNEQALYDRLKDINEKTHQLNYDEGFITEETYEKFKGKYIARLYEEFEQLGNSDVKGEFIDNKIFGKIYKERKAIDDWKVDNKITDPIYLTINRMIRTERNVAVKSYADHIVNSGVAKEEATEGYTKMEGKRFGSLDGMYVPHHIAEDFRGYFFSNQYMDNLYDAIKGYDRLQARQFLKKFHTVYSPIVQIGNFMSNHAFAFASGINVVQLWSNLPSARYSIKTKDADYQTLTENGILGSDIITNDLVALTPEAQSKLKIDASKKGLLNFLRKADEKATDVYASSDDVMKLSAYKALRKAGYSEKESIERVFDGFQNYATVGKVWDFAAKTPVFGNAYVKFQADLMRIMKNAVTKRPLSTAAFLSSIKLMTLIGSILSGEDDEEREIREDRGYIPKINLGFMDLPLVIKMGGKEVNLSRYISPYYEYNIPNKGWLESASRFAPFQFQTTNQEELGQEGISPEAQDVLLGGLYQAFIQNRDFRNKSVSDPYASRYKESGLTPLDKTLNKLDYVSRSVVPLYSTARDAYLSHQYGEDYYGRSKSVTDIFLSKLVKIQTYGEPELRKTIEGTYKGILYEGKIINSKIKSIQTKYGKDVAELSKRVDEGKLSPEKASRKTEAITKEAEKRVEGYLNELVKKQEKMNAFVEKVSKLKIGKNLPK